MPKILFSRYVPTFGSREEQPGYQTFPTEEALLNDPWIRSWRDHPPFSKVFSHYAVGNDHLLMAVYDDGWWVLGSLSGDPVTLPPFKVSS